jgi:hypothetical protein
MSLGQLYENPHPFRTICKKESNGFMAETIGLNARFCVLLNTEEKYYSSEPPARKSKRVNADEIQKMFQAYDLIEENGLSYLEVTRRLFPETTDKTPSYDPDADALLKQVKRWHRKIKFLISEAESHANQIQQDQRFLTQVEKARDTAWTMFQRWSCKIKASL